ncbi:MAG: hypothetical protein M1325_01180 [Actinobacteria bacterium]|nr:hypothetical protein [Actinomycetota bacterium]
MTLEFGKILTGHNCTLGGQTIISLSATEDIEADYATASAVCLAPGGHHAKGATVQSIEGGVSTGWWEVEDPVTLRSGARTWRRRAGEFSYAHLPLVSYRLRRKGYRQARATLSRHTLGSAWPPKFWSRDHYLQQERISNEAWMNGQQSWWDAQATFEGVKVVGSGRELIETLCRWVGLPVSFDSSVGAISPPAEYIPIGKAVIAAVKEVAAWGGASVYLDRNGLLHVYDFARKFGSGGAAPALAAVLEEEQHDLLYPTTHVTVVGTAFYDEWKTDFVRQGGAGGGFFQTEFIRHAMAVEVTESLAGIESTRPVEERIEIREYSVVPSLAQRIARERLTRIALQAGVRRVRGPAEGSQSLEPYKNHVFTVSRTLEWTGSSYRYEVDCTYPTSGMVWGGSVTDPNWR